MKQSFNYIQIINYYTYLLRLPIILLSLEVLFLVFLVGVPIPISRTSLISEDTEFVLERKFL